MPYTKPIFLSIIWTLCTPLAWGQLWPPITSLERTADLVVVAEVGQIVQPGGKTMANVTLQLQVAQTLKGGPVSSTLMASIVAQTQGAIGPVTFPAGMVGQTGLWFLKSGSNGYQILPRRKYPYAPGHLFLPLTGVPGSVPPADSLDDQLLSYMVLWYQSLDHSKDLDDNPFLSSFEPWTADSPTPQQVTSAVQPLIASSSLREQIVGLTAALRVGSTSALNIVISQIPALQSQPQFLAITTAIGLYPKFKDQSWVAPLQQLVALHTDAPGVDASAVGALRTIGTKAILPSMAELLDSKDPQAQLAAASFFGVFSLLANQQGEMSSSAPIIGPFATADTRAFTPRAGSTTTTAQYVAFWKTWWSQNQAQLGFPPP